MIHTIILFIMLGIVILLIALFSVAISRYIKKSNYMSSTHYGELVQLLQDKHELHRFGYGQYLKRGYSDFNAFHMSFMHMGMFVSLIFLANYIFNAVSISLSLLLFLCLAVFYLLTSVINGRLLGGQPTAGGLYHVMFKQVGSIWASFIGIIKLFAQLSTTVLYSFIMMSCLVLLLQSSIPFIQQPIMFCIGMVIIISTQALVASFKSAITRWVQGIGIILVWFIVLILSVSIMLVVMPDSYSPFYFLIGESPFVTSTQLSEPMAIAFVLILLARCFIGHDESGANAEETVEPKIKIPWAAYLSTSYTAIIGFVFLLVLGIVYFNVSGAVYLPLDTNEWLSGLLQLPLSVQYSLLAILLLICWMNGLFSLVNGARHVMAMARDVLVPFSTKLSSITLIRQTPHVAILTYAILASLVSFSYLAYHSSFNFLTQIIAISVMTYSLTYALVQFFSYFKSDTMTIWGFSIGVKFVQSVAIAFNMVMFTIATSLLSWQAVVIIFSSALLNVVYTYIKQGFVKLNVQSTIKKSEFEFERNFPLQ